MLAEYCFGKQNLLQLFEKKKQRKMSATPKNHRNSINGHRRGVHFSDCLAAIEPAFEKGRHAIAPKKRGSRMESEDQVNVNAREKTTLQQLERTGQELEAAFRNIDKIDTYVIEMRSDFLEHRINKQRFTTCMASAKIARVACCRRQVEKWRQWQSGIQDLHSYRTQMGEKRKTESDSKAREPLNVTHTKDDIDALLKVLLQHVTSFRKVIERLNPGCDGRTFLEKWVLKGRRPRSLGCNAATVVR